MTDEQEHHHHWQILLLILLVVLTFVWIRLGDKRKLAKRLEAPTGYTRVTLLCDASNNLYTCTSNGTVRPISYVRFVTEDTNVFKHAAY